MRKEILIDEYVLQAIELAQKNKYAEIELEDVFLIGEKCNDEIEVRFSPNYKALGLFEVPVDESRPVEVIYVRLNPRKFSRADSDEIERCFRAVDEKIKGAQLFTDALQKVDTGAEVVRGVRVWSREKFEAPEGEWVPWDVRYVAVDADADYEFLYSDRDLFEYVETLNEE